MKHLADEIDKRMKKDAQVLALHIVPALNEISAPIVDDFCDEPTHPSVRVQPRPPPRSVFVQSFALGGLLALGLCAVAYGAWNAPVYAIIAMFGFASVLTAALVLTGSVR